MGKLVVFDCDGTLVDSQFRIVEAMKMAFAGRGHPLADPEAVRGAVGLSLVDFVARILPGHGREEHAATAELYRQAFFTMRQQGLHEEPLYPGAVAALDAIRAAGCQLGVATGKSRRGLAAVLERYELNGHFTTLQTADTNAGKPHPEMLVKAMDEAGATPADTIMIGDTSFDMEMARNAGVTAIGVGWGYHAVEELTEAGASMIAASFAELPTLVLR